MQTAGRGRRGRDWESPSGNLAATYLTLTELAPADAAQVSFVAALAAADLVAAFAPADQVKVKWPNDVMVGPLKVCGILVESGRTPAGPLWLAVGVGVNLTHAPSVTERPATALSAFGPAPEPAQAMRGLADGFEHWLAVWRDRGFSAIATAWTSRAYGLGAPCTARLPAETVSGIAEGLDGDGALRLRLADGSLRRITAGDVFFEGA